MILTGTEVAIVFALTVLNWWVIGRLFDWATLRSIEGLDSARFSDAVREQMEDTDQ